MITCAAIESAKRQTTSCWNATNPTRNLEWEQKINTNITPINVKALGEPLFSNFKKNQRRGSSKTETCKLSMFQVNPKRSAARSPLIEKTWPEIEATTTLLLFRESQPTRSTGARSGRAARAAARAALVLLLVDLLLLIDHDLSRLVISYLKRAFINRWGNDNCNNKIRRKITNIYTDNETRIG